MPRKLLARDNDMVKLSNSPQARVPRKHKSCSGFALQHNLDIETDAKYIDNADGASDAINHILKCFSLVKSFFIPHCFNVKVMVRGISK